MSQSLVQIYLHIVFSTKHREPFLADALDREKMYGYLKGTLDNLNCPRICINGVADHVHILCRFSSNIKVSVLIRELKRDSSKWIKEQVPHLGGFYWQNGYGAFSVSPSHLAALKAYIANQEEHHRTESFQDEFRRLCRKYGVAIDERYVWD